MLYLSPLTYSDESDECEHNFDKPSRSFVVRTIRDYEPGEQLFINYGVLSNTRLLRNYGFTFDRNPHDTVALTLPPELQRLSVNDKMTEEKTSLLSELAINRGETTRSLVVSSKGEVASSSLLWLQMRHATQSELLDIIQQVQINQTLKIPLSLETRVKSCIRNLCQNRLTEHTTPIEVRRIWPSTALLLLSLLL